MVGPIRAGTHDLVDQMLVQFTIEAIPVDTDLARRAASVRARVNLELPDAFVPATAIHAERRGWGGAEIASFDEAVLRAHSELRGK